MTPKPTSTPASTDAKNTLKPTTPGVTPHSKQNWGGGRKSSGTTDQFIAGGAGHPKDHEVTPEDIAKFIEMCRERHGGK